MIYVDKKGHVNCEVSTSLGLRTQDIFSKEFCRTFLGIMREVHSVEAHQLLSRGTPSLLVDFQHLLAQDRKPDLWT